jgi:serine protease Do
MIQVGQTITGILTSEDPQVAGDSTYFQRWILPVAPQQAFTVDLQSTELDPYLILTRGRGEKILENDDGGGGCNARIVYTSQDDHPLRVIVNTASRPRRQTGHFTLRVTKGALPTEAKGNCRFTGGAAAAGGATSGDVARAVAVGQTQQGALTRNDVLVSSDSTYAQAWTIQARAGQTVTIDLESDTFDAYLFLRGPGVSGGRDFQDDDSGGNCNARLTTTFPQTGEYEVVVNSTGTKYATGAFSLSVTSGSKPKSVARCNRSQ